MVPSCLSSLHQKSLHLNPGPSPWTAWTSNMMSIFGQRIKPPTLQTTLALQFVPLPMLAISNAKTLVVITFHAPIVSHVNDTEFDGSTKEPFLLFGIVPSESTLVCMICKQPPKCIAICKAKIFYVQGKNSSQRACIHIGTHQHIVKVGDCRNSCKRINALLKEHVEHTPQATHNKIVFEVSKDIVGEFLLSEDSDTHRFLSLQELEPVFESCRELNSPNL